MKARYLIWIRRISQVFFLALFFFLLVETRLPQDIYLDYSLDFAIEQDIRLDHPITFFFQLDPLVWLTSLISGNIWIKGFLWAIGDSFPDHLPGQVFLRFHLPPWHPPSHGRVH